jgi:hypothetical protein
MCMWHTVVASHRKLCATGGTGRHPVTPLPMCALWPYRRQVFIEKKPRLTLQRSSPLSTHLCSFLATLCLCLRSPRLPLRFCATLRSYHRQASVDGCREAGTSPKLSSHHTLSARAAPSGPPLAELPPPSAPRRRLIACRPHLQCRQPLHRPSTGEHLCLRCATMGGLHSCVPHHPTASNRLSTSLAPSQTHSPPSRSTPRWEFGRHSCPWRHGRAPPYLHRGLQAQLAFGPAS